MSKKPAGMYERCNRCGKWLTLEQVDKYYNAYKTAYCSKCFVIIKTEENEQDGSVCCSDESKKE